MNHNKFANTVLYLLKRCPDAPGLTKLLKLVYFSDFGHYRQHLAPITGVAYVAAERGPVPEQYENLLGTLVDGGIVERREVQIFGLAKNKSEFRALREPNLNVFAGTELQVLDEVIKTYAHAPGTALSDISHYDGPWTYAWDEDAPGAPILYETSRWLDNMCDEDDLVEAEAALKRPHCIERVRELEPKFVD